MNHYQKLFLTGFLQVFFVIVNTYMVSRESYAGVAACSWIISFLWATNVKKVAFGNNWDKVIYALGASTGAVLGLLISISVFKKLSH